MGSSSSSFYRRKQPSPDRGGLLALLLACAFALSPSPAAAESEPSCVMLGQRGAVHVELSAREPERTYCLRAEKGQHLVAEITNARGVDPSGRVISPGGEMNGGPGGPFYRGEVRESGLYQIQVGQRGAKRTGSYDLKVELTPRR